MSDEYRRVLTAWAMSMLPGDLGATRVADVEVDYYSGWGGSDVTPGDDPELTIRIDYTTAAGDEHRYVVCENEDNAVRLTELIRALLRIAETPVS